MKSISIENLCKSYPNFKLDNVSFELEPGYIMGFIGRNGAGKTTTLKSMLHLVYPESGKIIINDYDITTQENEIKSSIGFVTGLDAFYHTKKLSTITQVTSKFYSNWNNDLYKELMMKFNLDENKTIKALSAGMKVKFQIVLAMCHDAKLLILDEPTSGLDPVSRDELVQLFQDYVSDSEHSILFSTHIISDLEKCADYITYIKGGKILTSTDIISFKESYLAISGTKDQANSFSNELKDKIIGLRVHNFGFEGIIKTEDKEFFNDCQINIPTMEDIMVHIER